MEGCQKAALRRRGPVCVIFAVTQIGVSSAKALTFTALKATEFWAMVADYVRLAHASKQFDSIVSSHFKR